MDVLDVLWEKRDILLKNRDHILKMPNNKKKAEMIQAYCSLLDYYQTISGDIGEELYIDGEFALKYFKCVYNDSVKRLSELKSNAQTLYDIFQKIVDSYKENGFCEYQYIGTLRVNKDKMSIAIDKFFSLLGEDVYKVFYNIMSGGNIASCSDTLIGRVGYSLNTTPIDNASIVVLNIPSYLYYYSTIAHEVGHCYQFYLQENQRNYSPFDPYCEVTSMLFDKLFIKYLSDIHMIENKEELDLEDNIYFFNNMCISKALLKLLIEKKIRFINPMDLSYTCKISEDEIKKEIINDCSYIKPRRIEPELYEIQYSFGDIISSFFYDKITADYETGWKEFKDFIRTVNYLPMKEVIEKYFNYEKINNDIKKLTKSYRER